MAQSDWQHSAVVGVVLQLLFGLLIGLFAWSGSINS